MEGLTRLAGQMAPGRIFLLLGPGIPEFFRDLSQLQPSAILQYGIEEVCGAGVPDEGTPFRSMDRGERPVLRLVRDLAGHLNCSRRFLFREAKTCRLNLERFLRWTVLLKGAAMFRSPSYAWSEVAFRLGFTELSAFSRFCSRLTGMSLRTVQGCRYGDLLQRGLDHVVGVPREVGVARGPSSCVRGPPIRSRNGTSVPKTESSVPKRQPRLLCQHYLEVRRVGSSLFWMGR